MILIGKISIEKQNIFIMIANYVKYMYIVYEYDQLNLWKDLKEQSFERLYGIFQATTLVKVVCL